MHQDHKISIILKSLLTTTTTDISTHLPLNTPINRRALLHELLNSKFYVHRLTVPKLLFAADTTLPYVFIKQCFNQLLHDKIQIVVRTAIESLSEYYLMRTNNLFTLNEIVSIIEEFKYRNDYLQAGVGDLFVVVNQIMRCSDCGDSDINDTVGNTINTTNTINNTINNNTNNIINNNNINNLLDFFLASPSWRVRLSLIRKLPRLSFFYTIITHSIINDNNRFIITSLIPNLNLNELLRMMQREEETRNGVVEEIVRRGSDNKYYNKYDNDYNGNYCHTNNNNTINTNFNNTNNNNNTININTNNTININNNNIFNYKNIYNIIGDREYNNIRIRVQCDSVIQNNTITDNDHTSDTKCNTITISTNTNINNICNTLPSTILYPLFPYLLLLDKSHLVNFKSMQIFQNIELILKYLKSGEWRERYKALEILYGVIGGESILSITVSGNSDNDGGGIDVNDIDGDTSTIVNNTNININTVSNTNIDSNTNSTSDINIDTNGTVSNTNINNTNTNINKVNNNLIHTLTYRFTHTTNRLSLIRIIFTLLKDPVSQIRKYTAKEFKLKYLKKEEIKLFRMKLEEFISDSRNNYLWRMGCMEMVVNCYKEIECNECDSNSDSDSISLNSLSLPCYTNSNNGYKELQYYLKDLIEMYRRDSVVNVREKVEEWIK